MIRNFKKYLSMTKIANIRELSVYLQSQPDAIRGVAELLIHKGYIRLANPAVCSSKCGNCQPNLVEVYEWVG